MSLAKKSAVACLSFSLMVFWLAGCGPTNGLPPLTGEFLYVSHQPGDVVSEYSIDTATGQLSLVTQFTNSATMSGGQYIAMDPFNEFVFIDAGASDLFSLDIGDGSFSGLIFLNNGPMPTGDDPGVIAVDPQGSCVYVTNYLSSSINNYLISSNGILTESPFGPIPAGGANPFGVAATRDLRLIVVNHSGSLTSYFTPRVHLNPPCFFTASQTIALTAAKSEFGPGPENVVIHPSLPYAYVTDDALGQVDEIALGEVNLFEQKGFAFLGAVRANPEGDQQSAPYSIVMHPSGKFLYTGTPSGNQGRAASGFISEFSIDPTTGLLTWQSNETVGVSTPQGLAIDASGKYLYATNFYSNNLAMFSIDPTTGALSPIGEPNTLTVTRPLGVVATH